MSEISILSPVYGCHFCPTAEYIADLIRWHKAGLEKYPDHEIIYNLLMAGF